MLMFNSDGMYLSFFVFMSGQSLQLVYSVWLHSKYYLEFLWYSMHLDYLTIEAPEVGKAVHMIIIADHFMQYAQALVTSLQTAKCTAQDLREQFVVHYGLPESIVADQSQNFESDLITELCKLAKVWKLHISPYHLQTNGQCECFNHILINMLVTLPPNKKSSWGHMVPMLEHVYNCTRSTVMGFSPYCLMHDQKAQLPVDMYLWYLKSGHEYDYKYYIGATIVGKTQVGL